MLIPRWRNALTMKNSLLAPTSGPAQFSAFHSTPTSCEKWKNKWNCNFDRGQQPTKTHVKYVTRQKRADAKKALKDLLFRSGSPRISFEDENPWKFDGRGTDQSPSAGKNVRSNHSARQARKSHYKKMKRKLRKESFNDDFEGNPETSFQATFGNRWYTWSFNPRQSHDFKGSTSGFDWRDHVHTWGYQHHRTWKWETASDAEYSDEEISIGSSSDRTILGLPPRGPLKIEDVKTAFRLSAMKWHPDKHQGPSQSVAEEKFKLCASAYKSLCSALSAV